MSFLVHIIVMSLFVTSIISQSHQRCLWWQRPCKTTTNRPMLVRYCDTWCEYPIGSGRFKCCDQVPDPTTTETPKSECPVDRRQPGDCRKAVAHLVFGSPANRCYRNSDCPSDLLCCYDACLGQTCKNPEFRKNEIAVKPMLFV